MCSISKIYSPNQNIPKLDQRLPIELHSIIGKYLGYSHHFFIIMRLMNNSKITKEIKEYLFNNCYPYYKRLKNIDIDYNENFENILLDNIDNIVEIHKILPLFYRKTNKQKFIYSNEYIKINELLTKGYSYQIDSDNSFEDEYENPLTCYVYLVYKLTEKHINEITPVQTIIALLAQDIYYSFKIIGDTKNLYFRAYYKTPSINKITTYTNKLKSKISKKFILHPSI